METEHVTGIPQNMGGSGNPSPITAYGVYMGMKASANFLWGSDKLEDKRILVQGVGHVGESLVEYLSEENADIFISDIDTDRLKIVEEKYDVEIIDNKELRWLELSEKQ